MSADLQMARGSAFLTLIQNLLAAHVASYTGIPNFLITSEPDEVQTSGIGGFVQCHVTMPDGSEYRLEVEAVE